MSRDNVLLVRRWFEEVWNQRRAEAIDELLLPTSVGHLESGDVRGGEEFKTVRAQLLSALPDLQLTIDDTVAEGDNVVARWTVYATHEGEGLGMSPTRRKVTIHGMTWFRIQGDYILEGWDRWNLGGLITQLQASEPAST
jgi:predicted ester cyclase